MHTTFFIGRFPVFCKLGVSFAVSVTDADVDYSYLCAFSVEEMPGSSIAAALFSYR